MPLRFLVFVLPLLNACAQGTVGSDIDAGADTADAAVVSRDARLSPVDSAEPRSDSAVDPCGVCCPGTSMCGSGNSVSSCRPDGSGYEETPCPEGDVCTDGACSTPPVCTPGSRDCLDATTTLLCRQTGEGWVAMTCDEGLVCADGICTDRAPWGAACAADDDCASQRCRCGADTGDNCPMFVGGGICVKPDCDATSCGQHGRCFDSDQASLGAADFDHCVRSCDELDPCPDGSRCGELPVIGEDGIEYANGCYFNGVAQFSEECSESAQCAAGACLTDYWDLGYCTRRCDSDGVCPQGAACVQLRPNEFWCSQLCGDGSVVGGEDCPLNEPTPRFDVVCKNMSTRDGSILRVCAHP